MRKEVAPFLIALAITLRKEMRAAGLKCDKPCGFSFFLGGIYDKIIGKNKQKL